MAGSHGSDLNNDPRPIRVIDPIGFDDRWITFAAKDPAGPLLIRVTRLKWEQLNADTPDEHNADDRRDYALGMIEHWATGCVPIKTAKGRLLIVDPLDP